MTYLLKECNNDLVCWALTGNVMLIIGSPSRAKGQANKGKLKISVMGDSLTEYQLHPKGCTMVQSGKVTGQQQICHNMGQHGSVISNHY